VSVSAVATDAAGNAGSAGTTSFLLDTVVPTLTVTDNGGNPATGVFTYNFTFNEAVTGFDATDVTVANGAKGTFSTTDASHYSLLVTPASSATPLSMTVDVAAGAAVDAAGNASVAAAQVLHSVLYGTAGAETLTVGSLADTVFLGAGNDVLKITHTTDSTAAALDRVLDFGATDKLDLTSLLGAGGAGYTTSVLQDTGAGFVELKNLTLAPSGSNTLVRFEVHFDSANFNGNKITGATIDLAYNATGVTNLTGSSTIYDDGFGGTIPVWQQVLTNVANGRIALIAQFDALDPIIDANGNVLNVRLTVTGSVSTFQVGLDSGAGTTEITTDAGTQAATVGITKVAGAPAGSTGVLEIVTDTGTLGTIGDNQLHMLSTYDAAHNLTHLQLAYDTNPNAGTTVSSSVIAMDFAGDVTANLIPSHLNYI